MAPYNLTSSENETYQSKIPGTLGGNKRLKIYGKLDCPSALRHIVNGHQLKLMGKQWIRI